MSWLEHNQRHMTRTEAIEHGIIEKGSTESCVLYCDEYIYLHDIEIKVVTDLTEIRDSMLLDSDTIVAYLSDEATNRSVSLVVRGYVDVRWCPEVDFVNGVVERYRQPSEFPKELKELIAKDSNWRNDPRVCVDENNWFELFVDERIGNSTWWKNLFSDVVDVENNTPEQIKDLLLETYEEVFEEVYHQRQESRSSRTEDEGQMDAELE